MLAEPIWVVARVGAILDGLGIRYVIGGSVASSIYGIPRATNDVDLVAELFGKHVDDFVARMVSEFYVDASMIREALTQGGSFNVIHLKTMFKVDVFTNSRDRWVLEELGRGRTLEFKTATESHSIRVASPEDVLLHKLVWYRLGGEVSERQWTDVIGLVRVRRSELDLPYLEQWAEYLKVADLLTKLLGT